jgi:VanZ family protein
MLPLRFARRWHITSAALLILVLASMLMPAIWYLSDLREFARWFANVDKWFHGVTFTFLAVWFSGQYTRRSYWRIATGLILFGLFIEGCQRLVTYRSAEWFDVAADSAGIFLGLIIALAGMGGWSLRFESRFANKKAGAES